MAHEVSYIRRDAGDMAYVGQLPWHGYGTELDPNADLDTWRIAAGMDWTVKEESILYWRPGAEALDVVPRRKALARSDTGDVLSIMAENYQVVQPTEVLEFYRDLIETNDLRMHTAGVLQGGRKVWALAELGERTIIHGKKDAVEGFVLLSTSYDGTLSTTCQFTTVRVVCANTLGFAVRYTEEEKGDRGEGWIKIPHFKTFNPNEMKGYLGLSHEAWKQWTDTAKALHKRKVDRTEVVNFMMSLCYGQDEIEQGIDMDELKSNSLPVQLINVYESGVGQDMAGHTAWGLVNAVTRYADHERRARDNGTRIHSAWFGAGARMKNSAWQQAVDSFLEEKAA